MTFLKCHFFGQIVEGEVLNFCGTKFGTEHLCFFWWEFVLDESGLLLICVNFMLAGNFSYNRQTYTSIKQFFVVHGPHGCSTILCNHYSSMQ